jgi:hypothetical protein
MQQSLQCHPLKFGFCGRRRSSLFTITKHVVCCSSSLSCIGGLRLKHVSLLLACSDPTPSHVNKGKRAYGLAYLCALVKTMFRLCKGALPEASCGSGRRHLGLIPRETIARGETRCVKLRPGVCEYARAVIGEESGQKRNGTSRGRPASLVVAQKNKGFLYREGRLG